MAHVVKFFLKAPPLPGTINSTEIEIPDPNAFSFPMFMQQVKANGFFVNAAMFVSYDAILCAFFGDQKRFEQAHGPATLVPEVKAAGDNVTPFPPKPEGSA